MKRNFNELFSKMKPAAQERAKARADELLKEIAEELGAPSADASSSAEESLPQRH